MTWRARVNLEMNNFAAAIDAFEQALKLVPNSAEYHANYAAALGERKRYVEAIKEAQIAQKLVTKDPAFTAHLKQLISRYQKAIEEQASPG